MEELIDLLIYCSRDRSEDYDIVRQGLGFTMEFPPLMERNGGFRRRESRNRDGEGVCLNLEDRNTETEVGFYANLASSS